MFDVVYYKNDTLVTVTGVKNADTDTFIDNATVRILAITEYGGSNIVGTFPIVLTYVPQSNGIYKGNLVNSLPLVPNNRYVCKLEVLTTDNLKGYWEFTFTCRIRNE